MLKTLFLLSLIVTIVFLTSPTLYEYDLGNAYVSKRTADPINQFFVVNESYGLNSSEADLKQGTNSQIRTFILKRNNKTLARWRILISSSHGLALLLNDIRCNIVYNGTDLFNADLEVERLEAFPALNPKMFHLRMFNRGEEVVWHGLIILDT